VTAVFALGAMMGCADRAGGGQGASASPETPATPPASGPAAWATIASTVSDAAGRPVAGAMVVPSAGTSTSRDTYAGERLTALPVPVVERWPVRRLVRDRNPHHWRSTNGATCFNSSVLGVINYVIGLP